MAKRKRNFSLLIVLLCLCMLISSCGKKEEKANPKPQDDFKNLETPLEELETGLLTVMMKDDLVPYYEKQIAAKKQQEEEEAQKETPPLISGGTQSPPTSPEKEKFKPEPITVTNTLLTEIIAQEIPESEGQEQDGENNEGQSGGEIPEEMAFVWAEINTKINRLHEQWNSIQPRLAEVKVPETALAQFGKSLNDLTIAGTSNRYMETLISANLTTSQFGEFMKASRDKAQSPLYYIKYYVREIVLNTANDEPAKASETMQSLRSQFDTFNLELSKKKVKVETETLKNAIDDFEQALQSKDLDLLKVKGSIVTKNIAAIKEKLAS